MTYVKKAPGCFEVIYARPEDMDPTAQKELLATLERELKGQPCSILFLVETLDVPPAVPKFWLEVTQRLAPHLCAMAVVSDSLVVRTAASGFYVSNRLRQVQTQIRGFAPEDRHLAEQWCTEIRAKAQGAAPRQ